MDDGSEPTCRKEIITHSLPNFAWQADARCATRFGSRIVAGAARSLSSDGQEFEWRRHSGFQVWKPALLLEAPRLCLRSRLSQRGPGSFPGYWFLPTPATAAGAPTMILRRSFPRARGPPSFTPTSPMLHFSREGFLRSRRWCHSLGARSNLSAVPNIASSTCRSSTSAGRSVVSCAITATRLSAGRGSRAACSLSEQSGARSQ
jgi:hypothetical protein